MLEMLDEASVGLETANLSLARMKRNSAALSIDQLHEIEEVLGNIVEGRRIVDGLIADMEALIESEEDHQQCSVSHNLASPELCTPTPPQNSDKPHAMQIDTHHQLERWVPCRSIEVVLC